MGVDALYRHTRKARTLTTVAAAVALLTIPAAAQGSAPGVAAATVRAASTSASTTAGTVADAIPGRPATTVQSDATASYQCLVLYPGGANHFPYSATYSALAPASTGANRTVWAAVQFPAITPLATINKEVHQVRVVFKPGTGTRLLTARVLNDLVPGTTTTTVTVRGDSVIVEAAGPFPGGEPFTLAPVLVALRAPATGAATLVNAGERLSDPAFSWVTSHQGGFTGPFSCFQLQPTTVVSVPVGGTTSSPSPSATPTVTTEPTAEPTVTATS